MHKIGLIIAREYITRVKNKTFLLTTFLTPLGILLLIVVASLIMTTGSDDQKNIAVYDPSDVLNGSLDAGDHLHFKFENSEINNTIRRVEEGTFAGVLEIIPIQDTLASEYAVQYHSDDQLAIDESSSIKRAIEKKLRDFKLKALHIDIDALSKIDTKITINPITIKEDRKVSSMTTLVSSAIGGIVGYAMFFIILLYGAQVMRSVMEEKINRVVEVLISTVKPFQLMMGKVVGVGLVGLTQIILWVILIPIVIMIGTSLFGLNPEDLTQTTNIKGLNTMDQSETMVMAQQVLTELKGMDWHILIPLYLLYFIGGYFAYAALFAAIGSAVGEDINESNALTFPVMLPLIFSMYIGMSAVSAPHSSLAVWSSMIPLLSSVVMPVRLPFQPPIWQVLVSIVLMIIFTVFMIWLAAKIYRTGILMYGKRATFKEMARWIFQ
ncbi:MAG: ABC transporter permease [Saprospiraceae bacterium]